MINEKKGRQKISNGIPIPIREKDVQQGLHMSYGHTKPYFVPIKRNDRSHERKLTYHHREQTSYL